MGCKKFRMILSHIDLGGFDTLIVKKIIQSNDNIKCIFLSPFGLNFIWTYYIWEKTNFGLDCPILIRWISNKDFGKSNGDSTNLVSSYEIESQTIKKILICFGHENIEILHNKLSKST